jgi:cell division septum initiation protein DivIVA
MSTAQVTQNARPRKQLADELDRLEDQLQRHDAILDALSEGLNAAVVDAARQGTEAAVKAAVVELLTNPTLRTALHGASARPEESRPSAWVKLKAVVRRAAARVRTAVGAAATTASTWAGKATAAVGRVVARVRASAHVRLAVRTLAAAGALAGLVRVGAVRRFLDLAHRMRSVVSNTLAAAGRWAQLTRLRLAHG